jgi:enoyl-CoA hydratase/carnithine racemase
MLLSTIDVSLPDHLFAVPQASETRDGVATYTHDAIAEVVLSRPGVLNAVDLAMWRRLAEIFHTLAEDEGIRAIVLRGAGGRAFSAGADITEFPARRTGAVQARVYNDAIALALNALRQTPQPVIAMIDGLAVGGGCEIAAAADIRIASDASRFGVPIGRLGVSLGVAEASVLTSLIGPGQTKRLVLTGELLSAQEALRIGLVEKVVTREILESETWRVVQEIVAAAPIAARATKLAVNLVAYGSWPEAERDLQRLAASVYDGSDLQEGISAFLEKREPRFAEDGND